MLNFFTPKKWYWQAEDGWVYSSERQVITHKDDDAFKAWVAAGNTATPWPRDEAGEQTEEALLAVISPHGLHLSFTSWLIAYAAEKRWRVETGGIIFNGMKISTDRQSQSMIANALAMVAATGGIIKFKTTSGFVDLTPETMQALALAVAAHVQKAFKNESIVAQMVLDGEITTQAGIDEFNWH